MIGSGQTHSLMYTRKPVHLLRGSQTSRDEGAHGEQSAAQVNLLLLHIRLREEFADACRTRKEAFINDLNQLLSALRIENIASVTLVEELSEIQDVDGADGWSAGAIAPRSLVAQPCNFQSGKPARGDGRKKQHESGYEETRR